MTTAPFKVKLYKIINETPDAKIWGMSAAERLRKQLARIDAKLTEWPGDQTIPQNESVLILRGDAVYDMPVLSGMLGRKNSLLSDGSPLAANITADHEQAAEKWLLHGGSAPAGLPLLTPETAGDSYNHQLRKREAPACYILDGQNRKDVEWGLFKTSYKGVTDLVTKYLWPVPAFHATRLCAQLKLTPNMVTSVGAVLMFLALYWFWQGEYGLGLLAGWVMTFLDTVDGKLARVTLTSSKWGNIFDHGIDLLHPPFWYIAWGMGLASAGYIAPMWLVPGLWAMFICYVVGRLMEGYFMRRYGFHLHVWRPFDSFFRLIVARRNPNMILLTLFWLFGAADIGLLAVILWTVAAVFIHALQLFQAEQARMKGQPVTSWLSRPA